MRFGPAPIRLVRMAVVGCLITLITRETSAQFRADPGAVINGKVIVTTYVTLGDLDEPYVPLTRYRLLLHGPQRDSTVLRTDDAGVVSVAVPPGNYRLVSSVPFTWKGQTYRWSLPVTVRPGMSVVDLTVNNAVRSLPPRGAPVAEDAGDGQGGATPVPASSTGAARAPTPARTNVPTSVATAAPKDGGVAVLFSVLLTGGGQMYAGKPGKGVALLLTSVGAVALGAAASNCSTTGYSYDTTCDVKPLAAGVGVALGNWIYSMISAPGDVRAWNARHVSVATARLAPVVSPGSGGTQVGLAVRW